MALRERKHTNTVCRLREGGLYFERVGKVERFSIHEEL